MDIIYKSCFIPALVLMLCGLLFPLSASAVIIDQPGDGILNIEVIDVTVNAPDNISNVAVTRTIVTFTDQALVANASNPQIAAILVDFPVIVSLLPAAAIPTLSQWGLLLLKLGLAVAGIGRRKLRFG